MTRISFKPMKGIWSNAIINSVEFVEGRLYFKVDKDDSKEQLHFNLSEVEAYALARDLILELRKTNSNFISMLQQKIIDFYKKVESQ